LFDQFDLVSYARGRDHGVNELATAGLLRAGVFAHRWDVAVGYKIAGAFAYSCMTDRV